LVFAHRRAYPLLAGRDVEIDCRRRLGIRSFFSSLLPAGLALAELGVAGRLDLVRALADSARLRLTRWLDERTGGLL
jgi:hypothetical protein